MRRTTTCWPAAPRYSSRSSGGTSSAIDIASSASGASCITFSGWNLSISEALEVIEWLAAGAAAVVRLAGRRAELAQPLRVAARTARAAHRGRAQQLPWMGDALLGRRNAEGSQLFASGGRQPVARPGRRKHLLQHRILV